MTGEMRSYDSIHSLRVNTSEDTLPLKLLLTSVVTQHAISTKSLNPPPQKKTGAQCLTIISVSKDTRGYDH